MKQLLQNLKTGEGVVADVPAPLAQHGRVIVRASASLVSAGTERAFVELGRKSLVGKAKERPDLVRKVVDKVKSEGLFGTLQAVREKLDESHALGYSAAGFVSEVGDGVKEFRTGDRVACAGAGYAAHAEVLSVPKNLCVRLPDAVDFESGAFATVGAIALQGVRLAEPTLGESVVVIGLGLVGQLTAQLLKANGCRVFGVDLDASKVELAKSLGMDDGCTAGEGVKDAVAKWTRGRGADAVLITAATSSDEPVELAGEISRLRGRVVAVGLVGMNIPRQIYFERELTLRVSMSYGPGRYDPEYEERGHDYPLAYVRWTEGRNLEAFLELVAAGSVRTAPLVTHRFRIEEAERAHRLISGDSNEPYLAVLIGYDTGREVERNVENQSSKFKVQSSKFKSESSKLESQIQEAQARGTNAQARIAKPARVSVGFVGAGDYARRILLPHFKSEGVEFRSIATASGVSARDVGGRYGFARFVSGADEVIEDEDVNLVVVATRHDAHAELARRALARGLSVFVEKPLALCDEELDAVIEAAVASGGRLTVGFNRRFSPHAREAKEFFADARAPLSILYRVNAGRVPRSHWTQDAREGGGRIRGEICHFVDFMQFMTGAHVERVFAESVSSNDERATADDSIFITLKFADGSNGSIAYLAEGDSALPKERVEIFGAGRAFVIEDFRVATSYRDGRETRTKLRAQDKGQREEVRAVCASVLAGTPAPIPLDELASTTRATFRILDSLRTGQPVRVISDK
ncbi:MAG TPA: bi-domain-containing oxidoreductase [Pyrinomonadaceae bacterium]|nr:bi-domain-containing oxidoreductase [Pyrinomonadaceae bacterium]